MIDQPIGIALVGIGTRGIHLGHCMVADPRCRMVAACDIHGDRHALARQAYSDPHLACYTDLEAMLADPRVQAVIVATPDPAHADNGIAVLRAGRHLLLEKPMAQTIADCDALIDTWRDSGAVFMVGLELRYCTLARDMKRLLDENTIGPVRVAYAVDNVSPGGQYFYHDHRRLKAHTLNLVLQKGTHTLDLMNWFINGAPQRVYAEGGLDVFGGDMPNDKRCRDCDRKQTCPYFMAEDFRMDYGAVVKQRGDLCVWAKEVEVEDNTIVTVRYDNGAKMTYIECHFTPDYNRHFTLIGDKGRMYGYYDNDQNFAIELTWRHSDRKEVIHPTKAEGAHGGGDPAMIRQFVDLVAAGRPCCPGVLGARDSAAIAIAAEQAIIEGLPVVISPAPIDRAPEYV